MSVAPISSNAGLPAEPAADLMRASRSKATAFNAASLRGASAAEQRTAVAAQFEAILVRQLLGKTMSSMLGGTEGGVAGSVYGDMLTDTLSQQLTAGQGLGLGRYIEQQLGPKQDQAPATGDQGPHANPPVFRL